MNYFTQPIYTADDLKRFWGSEGNTFKKRLSYHLKAKKLYKLRKGLYIVEDARYHLTDSDVLLLANKIYTPSYISFETVLQQYGVIFQSYETSLLAGPYNKELSISVTDDSDPIHIQWYRLPLKLLVIPLGIMQKAGYAEASLERAICDTLWRSPLYSFDRMDTSLLHIKKLLAIASIYTSVKASFKNTLDRFLHSYGLSTTITS